MNRITINKRSIATIVKKELKGYFDNPTAYVIIVVFLILWQFLFFKSAFLAGEASLRILLGLLPWMLLFFIPAITMGSISQERGEGTLEFLLTRSLKYSDFIIGKFLGSLIFACLALLFIFPIAWSFSWFGKIDWGVIFGQYFASALFSAVLISFGIFVSSFFKSQISALLVSIVGSFLLIVAGMEIVTAGLPLSIAQFIERLSALSHFESMARGVLDARDIWYFVSFIFVFLGLTYFQLLREKRGSKRVYIHKNNIGFILLVLGILLSNISGAHIPGRIDLTQDRVYTLTDATKKTVSSIPESIKITLFASSGLPAQLQPILRDIKDILRDYKILGKGKIEIETLDPSGDAEIAEQASILGVRPVQFNVMTQEEVQLKQGFLGISISRAEQNEAMPFIQTTRDLEYQLTSIIQKLTITDKKKIGFLSGHGEKTAFVNYQSLTQELEKQFDITNVNLTQNEDSIPNDISVLVLTQGTDAISEPILAKIKTYIDNGGAGLFLLDGININPQFFSVTPNEPVLNKVLSQYGAEVQSDLVFDTKSNQTVSFGGGFVNVFVPYAYWIRAKALDISPVTARLNSIVLPWASSIIINNNILKEKGLIATKLFTTTNEGGAQTENFSIDPQVAPTGQKNGEQIIAVSIEKSRESDASNALRIVAIGDSDFIESQFASNAPENIGFALEALSWLSQEESLAGLQIKQQVERKLQFENSTEIGLVKYGNLLFAFLLPAGFGIVHLSRRRGKRKMVYKG